MSADDAVRGRKLALNQSRFRSSNERVRRATHRHRFEATDCVPFICECADRTCFEIVMLSLEEYERVRSHANRFLLVAGHEDDEATHERIIEAERGYAIVEKVGAAGAEAARLDEREAGTE